MTYTPGHRVWTRCVLGPLLENAQKDLMIYCVKGGRQVQHGESSHTSLVYGCNSVIMYLDQRCLRWVVFTVCRLDRWKKVKQIGVLGEPGINDTLKNLWDKAQVRNWSIWIQVASVNVGLLQQRTNYSWLMCDWKFSLRHWSIAQTLSGGQ